MYGLIADIYVSFYVHTHFHGTSYGKRHNQIATISIPTKVGLQAEQLGEVITLNSLYHQIT